jgi:ribulose-5-phosphate 4-epimerase/fuculose-1-phosphate aldolase
MPQRNTHRPTSQTFDLVPNDLVQFHLEKQVQWNPLLVLTIFTPPYQGSYTYIVVHQDELECIHTATYYGSRWSCGHGTITQSEQDNLQEQLTPLAYDHLNMQPGYGKTSYTMSINIPITSTLSLVMKLLVL